MRRALLVGIDDYPFGALSASVADARRMNALLSRNADGSPNFATRLITVPDAKLTRARLREAIDELFRDPADVGLFYFAGHGTETNLDGYLVTPDATTYDEGVSLTEVLGRANASSVSEVVILLDSCQSGALGAVPAVNGDFANIREGVSILTATRSTQNASENPASGLFTTLVAAALDGGAADVLGKVTVASVYAYVEESLGPWDQRPLFKAHVSTLVALRETTPAVELDALRRLPEWFPTDDATFALDPSYEPTAEPHDAAHEQVFLHLQHCRSAKLVEPVDAEHMYFAAMNSTGCRLTALGGHYRRLASEGRI